MLRQVAQLHQTGVGIVFGAPQNAEGDHILFACFGGCCHLRIPGVGQTAAVVGVGQRHGGVQKGEQAQAQAQPVAERDRRRPKPRQQQRTGRKHQHDGAQHGPLGEVAGKHHRQLAAQGGGMY